LTELSAGRVGRSHGRDGSFYVDQAQHPLPEGTRVRIGGAEHEIVRRAGTDDRPLVRLAGIDDPAALHGEPLLIEGELEQDEYLVADLVGCEVPGVGYVERVIAGISCDVLEVGQDGVLIPLVSDAVKRVDVDARRIEVDRRFLDL
jgi:16S rRNA processing protein RimM